MVNSKTPFEILSEKIAKNQSRFRKALIRGGFLLVLTVIITYYGKFRLPQVNIVSKHTFTGWVFQKSGVLGVLLILPNDGIESNDSAKGERIFFNPILNSKELSGHYIRYQANDIYLLGEVPDSSLQSFCSDLDSAATIFFEKPKSGSYRGCGKAKSIPGIPMKIGSDWMVEANYSFGKDDKGKQIMAKFSGQKIVINQGSISPPDDSVLLYIQLNKNSDTSNLNLSQLQNLPSRIILAPGEAYNLGQAEKNLIIEEPSTAIAFYIQDDGLLKIKKVYLGGKKNHDLQQ